jgi:uncharacterized membrane protein YcaP (DUF421 family)
MPEQPITPFDWHRLFVGDLPWWFALEIALRTGFMYLFALLAVRFISRRAIGQLSFIEFLLVIALGSAVGDPMFYPEVPLLHGMVVVVVVVALNRGVTAAINRSEAAEAAIEGSPFALVEEGRLCPEAIDAAHLNREKVFELLRVEGVRHLGELRRGYMEQRGVVSLWPCEPGEERAGLRVMPPWDLEPPRFFEAGDRLGAGLTLGCERCGDVRPVASEEAVPTCPRCGGASWVDAVVEPRA